MAECVAGHACPLSPRAGLSDPRGRVDRQHTWLPRSLSPEAFECDACSPQGSIRDPLGHLDHGQRGSDPAYLSESSAPKTRSPSVSCSPQGGVKVDTPSHTNGLEAKFK